MTSGVILSTNHNTSPYPKRLTRTVCKRYSRHINKSGRLLRTGIRSNRTITETHRDMWFSMTATPHTGMRCVRAPPRLRRFRSPEPRQQSATCMTAKSLARCVTSKERRTERRRRDGSKGLYWVGPPDDSGRLAAGGIVKKRIWFQGRILHKVGTSPHCSRTRQDDQRQVFL